MSIRPIRRTLFAAAALGAAALLALALPGLRGPAAQAQGIMSAPACQCSAPTAIAGISATIVHCICGAMSCAVTEYGAAAKRENQMQCVRP